MVTANQSGEKNDFIDIMLRLLHGLSLAPFCFNAHFNPLCSMIMQRKMYIYYAIKLCTAFM